MKGTKDVDRSRASGQDTRRRILAAAGELFSARGYEDVTIRDIAAAADADPALVIRYFTSKNDLFVLVRQPDLQLTPAPGQPLTAQNVTRALVELSLAQSTRLFDVTAVGPPEATELLRTRWRRSWSGPLWTPSGWRRRAAHISRRSPRRRGSRFHAAPDGGARPAPAGRRPAHRTAHPSRPGAPRYRSTTGLALAVHSQPASPAATRPR